MKLELTYWDEYKKIIPVYRKNGEEKEKMDIENISVSFCIYKGDKKEFETDLEKEEDGFELELSEDDIATFEKGEYTGELKVKIGKKTQRKQFEIIISD